MPHVMMEELIGLGIPEAHHILGSSRSEESPQIPPERIIKKVVSLEGKTIGQYSHDHGSPVSTGFPVSSCRHIGLAPDSSAFA